eukprot:GHVS01022526.1.p1 GENE.GHVS01022526.1~~GHVS01022526.1.p1  ORF type:complete len:601 (-),score=138.26 GHVS01022526.1:301-1950(-)
MFATLKQANLPSCSPSPISSSSPHRIWASVAQFATHRRQHCWAETVVTPYNVTADRYDSVAGVQVTVDGEEEGSVRGFDYLDYFFEHNNNKHNNNKQNNNDNNDNTKQNNNNNAHQEKVDASVGVCHPLMGSIGVPETQYFHESIKAFKSVGYSDGVNLAGRPFDWRLPLWQVVYRGSEWAERTKLIVEELYVQNNNRKVVIIAHSLGTLMALYFLNTIVAQPWKDRYIDSFVSIGGVYGGSFKVVKALLSGYNDPVSFDLWNVINISLVPADLLKHVHRTMGSMYSLAPNPQVFGKDFVVATVPRNTTKRHSSWWWWWWRPKSHYLPDEGVDVYTTSNWTLALPHENTIMLQQAFNHMHNITLTDPQVPVYCLWGNFDKLSTDQSYVYDSSKMDSPPSIIYGEGDDTVPLASLSYCSRWGSTVMSREFANLDHMFMFDDTAFNRFLVSLVTGLEPVDNNNGHINYIKNYINTYIIKCINNIKKYFNNIENYIKNYINKNSNNNSNSNNSNSDNSNNSNSDNSNNNNNNNNNNSNKSTSTKAQQRLWEV